MSRRKRWPDGSEMKYSADSGFGKLVDKEPEQGRLAHAGCSEDQGDFALLFEELEPGQGLLHAGSRCSHWTGGFRRRMAVREKC